MELSSSDKGGLAGEVLVRLLIDIASMADVVQIDAALLDIEFVQNSVVANSQLEFRSALKSSVGKSFKARTHLVDLAPHGLTDWAVNQRL
jgi:hypothetical protein